MATSAMESAQPDLAGLVIARTLAGLATSPRGCIVIAGRLAIAAGRADEALTSAELTLAAATAAATLDRAAPRSTFRPTRLDYAGRRDEARRVWTRQAEEAAAAGLTQAQMRAVVQLGKLEVFEGTEPDRLYEAVDVARAAGALVEEAWAEENLAVALILQGDPLAERRILDDAISRCRDLRLDQLPYLLAAGGGTASSTATPEHGGTHSFAEAEALAPTVDMAILTNSMEATSHSRSSATPKPSTPSVTASSS